MTLIRGTDAYERFITTAKYLSNKRRITNQEASDLLTDVCVLVTQMAAELEHLQKEAGLK